MDKNVCTMCMWNYTTTGQEDFCQARRMFFTHTCHKRFPISAERYAKILKTKHKITLPSPQHD